MVVEENEDSDHASWMYKDLEGAGDGNIFSEVPKKKVDEKIKDVLVEDWWSDDEGDGKDALRSKFVLSDDEDHLDGDGCTEFNEETVMKNIHFEIEMKFTNHAVFRRALIEWSVRGRFDFKYIQNDKKRITAIGEFMHQ